MISRIYILFFLKRLNLIKNIIHQKDIFRQKLLPFLEKKKECAYFLVDGFRYEMGEDFFHSIENYQKKNISPVLALTKLSIILTTFRGVGT